MAKKFVKLSKGGGAELNIAYGDTAPENTSKLWVKTAEPSAVKVSSKFNTRGRGENIEVLPVTMPTRVWTHGAAAVNEKIYMFGGGSGGSKTIQCFDKTEGTATKLSVVLPAAGYYYMAMAVGTIIYVFGGVSGGYSDKIYRFDTVTETISTLAVSCPAYLWNGAFVIEKNMYLVSGKNNTSMYCFDTATETFSTLGDFGVPKRHYRSAVAMGTTVYLFGGQTDENNTATAVNDIYRFDFETKTATKLSATLPSAVKSRGAAYWGSSIYLFGGSDGTNSIKEICRFDTISETVSTLPVELPFAINGVQAANTLSDGIYIYSGNSTNDVENNNMFKFTADLEILLDNGKVQIDPSLADNTFTLINTDTAQVEIGVNKVYKGNADGVGEVVTAALYKNNAWVTI